MVACLLSEQFAGERLQPTATGKGPPLSFLAEILVGEGLPGRESRQKNNLDNYHRQRHSVEIWTIDARHNSLQRLLGSPRDTLARNRAYGGCAALGAQAWLDGVFPGRRGGGRASCGQQERCGDRRAAAYQYERTERGQQNTSVQMRHQSSSRCWTKRHSWKVVALEPGMTDLVHVGELIPKPQLTDDLNDSTRASAVHMMMTNTWMNTNSELEFPTVPVLWFNTVFM